MNETKMGGAKDSNAPMILGIFGFIFSIPQAMCAGACAGCATLGMLGAQNGSEAAGASTVFMVFILPALASITAFIFSFKTKNSPKKAGIVLIICSIVLLIISFSNPFTLFFGLIASALYLIAGVLSVKNASK